ncbi:DUF3313 domain-containing protein [Caulobacter sp. 17J65-9]|uniref:DUF3313 domain-containing protein n=1 Tax=Caulobacter sp. 17J65-9 TaxID=2709382 RepID=UPI0013C5805F|nr:DUF3313 domain-containing protein [Caulobacter sp. 17J65-9]NEX92107.1 DUF3313 domain-containing protein [Caulobacter sp. 17J65-9]
MRSVVFAAALTLLAGPALAAAPPVSEVTVSIGPKLQAKAEGEYGVADVKQLAAELETDVENALRRGGRLTDHGGGRMELVLVDAVPNLPTAQQLTATPWLTRRGVGTGGAAIEGRLIGADGKTTPIAYKWYQTDIRFSYGAGTWTDAGYAFDKFADRVARGEY